MTRAWRALPLPGPGQMTHRRWCRREGRIQTVITGNHQLSRWICATLGWTAWPPNLWFELQGGVRQRKNGVWMRVTMKIYNTESTQMKDSSDLLQVRMPLLLWGVSYGQCSIYSSCANKKMRFSCQRPGLDHGGKKNLKVEGWSKPTGSSAKNCSQAPSLSELGFNFIS